MGEVLHRTGGSGDESFLAMATQGDSPGGPAYRKVGLLPASGAECIGRAPVLAWNHIPLSHRRPYSLTRAIIGRTAQGWWRESDGQEIEARRWRAARRNFPRVENYAEMARAYNIRAASGANCDKAFALLVKSDQEGRN